MSASPIPSCWPDQQRACRVVEERLRREHGLDRAEDEERAEDPHLERRRRESAAVARSRAAAGCCSARWRRAPRRRARVRRALDRPQREARVRARDDGRRERAVPLPCAEVERLVAEQDVVRAARRGEPRLRLARAACRASGSHSKSGDVRCHAQAISRTHDATAARPRPPGVRRRSGRVSPRRPRSRETGARKIRCRDSGDGRAAELRQRERGDREAERGRATSARACAAQADESRGGADHDEQRHGPPACGRVARRPPEIAAHEPSARRASRRRRRRRRRSDRRGRGR